MKPIYRAILIRLLLTIMSLSLTTNTLAQDDRKRAQNLYQRMTGVKASSSQVDDIVQLLNQGRDQEAAQYAQNTEDFYVNVAQFFKNWHDKDGAGTDIDIPLNDFIATGVGMVRDNIPLDQMFSADILYTFGVNVSVPYATNNNAHYQTAESQGISFINGLQQVVQSDQHPEFSADETAGLLTLRGNRTYIEMGTNRRPYKLIVNFTMCKDLTQVMDTTIPGENYVGRDVTRTPGGDPSLFQSKCLGCHAKIDIGPKTAFSHLEWDERDGNGRIVNLNNTSQQVRNRLADANNIAIKVNRNEDTYPSGHVITNQEWKNHFVYGVTKSFNWKGQPSGSGLKSYGYNILKNDQFPLCMAESVFKSICNYKPITETEKSWLQSLAYDFQGKYGFAMKPLWAEIALHCADK